MPGDPSYRRPPGYDPDAARWAQISRGLLEAGARLAAAPRRQAIGQGLQGFIAGSDAGKQAYEDDLSKAIGRRQLEALQTQDGGSPADNDPPSGGIENLPPAAAAWTEDQIDHMPLFQLSQIDPAQLSPSGRQALSRRLFQEGF
jgi:hypothetical protein